MQPRTAVLSLASLGLAISIGILTARGLTSRGDVAAGVLAATILVVGIVAHPGPRSVSSALEVDFMDRLAFVFTGLAVLTITFNGVRLSKGVGIFDGFLLLGASCLAIHQASGRALPRLPRWSYIPAYLIAVAGLTSTLLHGAAHANVPPTVRFAIAIGVTPVVIGLAGRTRKRRQTLLIAWIAGACLNSLIAISDFMGLTHLGPSIVGRDNTTSGGRFAGLTAHPNHLAIVAAMALPVALAEISATDQRTSRRLLSALTVGILAVGILVSGSRAGVLAGSAAIVATALIPGTGGLVLRRLLPIGFAIVTAVVVGALSKQRSLYLGFDRLLHPTTSDLSSNNARSIGFHHAMHDFFSSPLVGSGFSSITSALDIFLQLLQAGGILAVIAFFVFLRGSTGNAYRISRSPWRPRSDHRLALALIISIGAWLVFGLFQNSIYDRFLYVPASLILAMYLERSGRSPEPYEAQVTAMTERQPLR